MYFISWQYGDGSRSSSDVRKTVHHDSRLCIRKTVRARDYLNGYEPFGRYNFFNISTPIGAGRRPLKDHPSTKVGRLPRRHRKTPSSGSGAAPVISRKPHHFACIIHSNSPGSPLAAQRRISHRDRKEATWNAIISPPCPLLHEKQTLLPPTLSSECLIGPRLLFDIREASLTIYFGVIRTHFTS